METELFYEQQDDLKGWTIEQETYHSFYCDITFQFEKFIQIQIKRKRVPSQTTDCTHDTFIQTFPSREKREIILLNYLAQKVDPKKIILNVQSMIY